MTASRRERSLDRKELKRAEGAGKAHERKVFQSPDRDSVEKEFGKENVKDDPKNPGGWICTVKHDQQKIKRAAEMMSRVHKEDSERGKEVQSMYDKEDVFYPDGTRRQVYGHLMDATRQKVKGMRGVGRFGLAPTEYFGLSQSYGKYEQGPEGLWFVWNDGWEPTKLWESQAKGDTQRDPDGNVWVKVEGEWTLSEE